MLTSVFVIFLAFLGFLLSLYIRHKKAHRETHLVCPLKGDCKQVIFSEYASFFGLPVEGLGMLYYTLIAVGYLLIVLLPDMYAWLPNVILPITITALLFSSYLTFIQLFQIKQICTWCLLSALLSLGIFLLAFISALAQVIPFLAAQAPWIIIVHGLAAAIGLGAATMTDVFFFRFLKDQHINEFEVGVLRTLSQVIWLMLAVILVSGLGLYLPDAAALNDTPKFLVKVVALLVIILNGTVMNLLIMPKLVKIGFGDGVRQSLELFRARKFAYVCGPVSLISWYAVFILGSLRSLSLSFFALLGIYVALLGVGVIFGLVLERRMNRSRLNA